MSVINPADGGSILEYTSENTIGDPYVSEPRLVKGSGVVSILKGIGQMYVVFCVGATSLYIIVSAVIAIMEKVR